MPPSKKSFVWTYFEVKGETAQCVICKSTLSHKNGSTSNLSKHIKSKHIHVLNPPETVENLVSSPVVGAVGGEAVSAASASVLSTPSSSSLGQKKPLPVQPTLRHCVESTKMLEATSHKKQAIDIKTRILRHSDFLYSGG